MLNGKAIFFFLLAIVFGGSASVFANKWLQQQAGMNVPETAQTTSVVVAARDIPFGQPIEESYLKTINWPSDALPANSIENQGDVIGKIANQKIVSGEPVLDSRLVDKLAGSTLSSLIAPNKRAITLRVNDVVGVAGFLLPGNRVDVLGTRMVNRRAQSKTILQNLKVLAVDQKANPDKDEPVVVRAVTLEADLDESIELVKATQEGTVQLVLRNPDDLATRINPPEQVAAVPQQRVRKRAEPTVKIIRGVSVNNTTVRN